MTSFFHLSFRDQLIVGMFLLLWRQDILQREQHKPWKLSRATILVSFVFRNAKWCYENRCNVIPKDAPTTAKPAPTILSTTSTTTTEQALEEGIAAKGRYLSNYNAQIIPRLSLIFFGFVFMRITINNI